MEFLTDKAFNAFKNNWLIVTISAIVLVLFFEFIDKHSVAVYTIDVYMWFCLFYGGFNFIGGISELVNDAMKKTQKMIKEKENEKKSLS